MTREEAVATERLWAGVARTEAGMASGWHHHGDFDSTIYVLSGALRMEFGQGGAEVLEAGPGDFLHVAPGAVHRESNPSDEECRIVVVGSGSGALLGYALILWSPAFVHGMRAGGGSFGNALYSSGADLFTLGVGGGITGWTRAVAVAEGATGLGLFAVVIAYLPVLYQAFNRREVGVLLLDARAGSPPSGPELLHRMGSAGVASSLPQLFAEWERWVADVLESHMSYPILALFRSPHDNTSWVTSLGSVLDAATLILTSVDDEPGESAKLFYGTGVHAVEDLFYYFRLTEREAVIQRHEFEDVLNDLKDDGFSIRPVDEAFARFTEKRAKYAPRLDAIVVLLAAPPGQWIGDRSFLGARTAH